MPMLAKFLPLEKEEAYREAPQHNPIRWQLFFQQDDTLVPQTSKFKCKDFFNDVVGWYHGKTGSIYGFDTTQKTFNDFGVFVRLSGLRKSFQHNIEAVVNPLLETKLLFVEVGDGELLTLFPRYLFNNTFLISKVTHLVRLCNLEEEVNSFEELQKTNKEEWFSETLINLTLPEEYQTYWYYAAETHNGRSEAFSMTILHNNGYVSWKHGTLGKVQ